MTPCVKGGIYIRNKTSFLVSKFHYVFFDLKIDQG